ncbi:DUF397 domain-containing protein [Kitasatospora sp. NPDC098663]|uniref:DUF397 domain-containing protein n=1 Tax=Kitasatospora sp. NPDC098663 TaxID=3364096 RepID=UPI00381FB37F
MEGGFENCHSKDPSGPALASPSPAWRAFVTAVRAGGFGAHQQRLPAPAPRPSGRRGRSSGSRW